MSEHSAAKVTDTRSLSRPCYVTIDAAAIRRNYQIVRKLCPSAEVMAVIKADAYGHGMELAVEALRESSMFAVSGLDDLWRIRATGAKQSITILSDNLDHQQIESIAADDVATKVCYTVFDHQQLDALAKARPAKPLFVWLKIDTGMGRLGFSIDEAADVCRRLQACDSVAEVGLMSHLANADRPYRKANAIQLSLFENLVAELGLAKHSLLNSGGICNWSDYAYEIVRPGLMLYGASPINDETAAALNLKPAMQFFSQLISVKNVSAGQHIGYGGIDRVDQDTTLGVVACGYGDGYPRHARSGTPVLVNGVRVPLIGRVSMDMIAVDLTEVTAAVGDPVTLWGQGLTVEEVAEWADTIAYELLCGITQRVERINI